MDFNPSQRSREVVERVGSFIRTDIAPIEEKFFRDQRAQNHGGDWKKWSASPVIENLKAKARAEGLSNLFLPDATLGGGLSTLDYALVAEAMGHSLLAPEIFNCN